MRLTKLSLAGISLVAFAVFVVGAWTVALKTAIDKPIDMPLTSLNGLVHTSPFIVNRNRLYTIRVVAKKNISFDMLNCLLGMPLNATPCSRPSVIEASWVLSSDGKVFAQGKSDDDPGGAWAQDEIERELGTFQSESGRTYVLNVDFIEDASALVSSQPHLKVEVSTDYYEGNMWITFALELVCLGFAVTGVALLVASAVRTVLKRHHTSL